MEPDPPPVALPVDNVSAPDACCADAPVPTTMLPDAAPPATALAVRKDKLPVDLVALAPVVTNTDPPTPLASA
jgi:hypothetical protein